MIASCPEVIKEELILWSVSPSKGSSLLQLFGSRGLPVEKGSLVLGFEAVILQRCCQRGEGNLWGLSDLRLYRDGAASCCLSDFHICG